MSSPRSQPTLVLVHGLFSSPMEFALLARVLRARGVAFDCLEIDGYTEPGQAPRLSWRAWVDRADAALDARYGADASIVLGGLCVGGMIAAALALRPRRQKVEGLVLMSPTFAYDGWSIGRWQRWRRLAYALRFDRWITVREKHPFGIRNEKTRGWVEQQLAARTTSAVGPARLPLAGIRETERLYAFITARIASIRVPLLALHARDDEIASIESVERVLERATTTTRLVVLENSYHMITIDNDRQVVAHALADFVTCSTSAFRAMRATASATNTTTASRELAAVRAHAAFQPPFTPRRMPT